MPIPPASDVLAGLRVLDLSRVRAGPACVRQLADWGADVVKIEPPPALADPDGLGGPRHGPDFQNLHRNKRSLTLDLKAPEGREAFLRLAARADVVVENFRPGVMARLGLDPDVLCARHPSLIWCSISGFGQDGPLADLRANDQIVQSLSGLMLLSGREGEPAQRVGFPIVDTFTGLLAAFAIQTALLQRERGLVRGQKIDVAMLDAALVLLASVVNPLLMTGARPERTGNRGFSRAPTADTFACAEGEITLAAVEDAQVARALEVLGLEELLDRPEFSTRLARAAHADALAARIAERLASKSAAEWFAAFRAAGVPAAPVQDLAQALAMPHLEERGLFLSLPAPQGGHERILNAGFRFRTGGPGVNRPAPPLGDSPGPATTTSPGEERPTCEASGS